MIFCTAVASGITGCNSGFFDSLLRQLDATASIEPEPLISRTPAPLPAALPSASVTTPTPFSTPVHTVEPTVTPSVRPTAERAPTPSPTPLATLPPEEDNYTPQIFDLDGNPDRFSNRLGGGVPKIIIYFMANAEISDLRVYGERVRTIVVEFSYSESREAYYAEMVYQNYAWDGGKICVNAKGPNKTRKTCGTIKGNAYDKELLRVNIDDFTVEIIEK